MTPPRPGVWLLLILLTTAGCEREITSGDYGPLSIGQLKTEAIEALIAYGKRLTHIHPVPYPKYYIESPSRDDLARHLSSQAGVLVWIGKEPFPLRIEFETDLVSNVWPVYRLYPATAELMKSKRRELIRLRRLIALGMSREAVFDTLTEFESIFEMAVGNFVVGYQKFRTTRAGFDDDPDYRNLLLANDAWKFRGLKEELWYEPFYSNVTIIFRNDRIERIMHSHFPFELP